MFSFARSRSARGSSGSRATDKTFRLYPEAYHLLWNDWDKELVLADILAWLNERSAVPLNT